VQELGSDSHRLVPPGDELVSREGSFYGRGTNNMEPQLAAFVALSPLTLSTDQA
jgi:hypothetical protein